MTQDLRGFQYCAMGPASDFSVEFTPRAIASGVWRSAQQRLPHRLPRDPSAGREDTPKAERNKPDKVGGGNGGFWPCILTGSADEAGQRAGNLSVAFQFPSEQNLLADY
jgi:hypothetical protein